MFGCSSQTHGEPDSLRPFLRSTFRTEGHGPSTARLVTTCPAFVSLVLVKLKKQCGQILINSIVPYPDYNPSTPAAGTDIVAASSTTHILLIRTKLQSSIQYQLSNESNISGTNTKRANMRHAFSSGVGMLQCRDMQAPGYRTQKKILHRIPISHAYNLAYCNMNHTAIENPIVNSRNQPQHTHKENTVLDAMVMHAGRHRITRNDIESHHRNMHHHSHTSHLVIKTAIATALTKLPHSCKRAVLYVSMIHQPVQLIPVSEHHNALMHDIQSSNITSPTCYLAPPPSLT